MANQKPMWSSIHTVVFDFDGIFTNNKVWVDQDGRESVVCDRADGLAIDFVRAYQRRGELPVDFFILSKEANPVVLSRAAKLKLKCHHGVSDKYSFLDNYFSENFPDNHSPFDGVIYLGNDLNDLPVMRKVGFSVAPSDAHPLVRECAKIVLPKKGGDGFVRAFVELLLGVDKLNEEKIDELISNC